MTTQEAAAKLGIKPRAVTYWANKIGLTNGPGRHLSLTERQVKRIAYVMRTQGISAGRASSPAR